MMWKKTSEEADIMRSNKKIKIRTKDNTNEEISCSEMARGTKGTRTRINYKDSLVGSSFFNHVSLKEGQVEDYIDEDERMKRKVNKTVR